MPATPRFPTGQEPTIDVRPALRRFKDFATVVGTQRPDAGGFWCMAYRDSRVPTRERRCTSLLLVAPKGRHLKAVPSRHGYPDSGPPEK